MYSKENKFMFEPALEKFLYWFETLHFFNTFYLTPDKDTKYKKTSTVVS